MLIGKSVEQKVFDGINESYSPMRDDSEVRVEPQLYYDIMGGIWHQVDDPIFSVVFVLLTQ